MEREDSEDIGVVLGLKKTKLKTNESRNCSWDTASKIQCFMFWIWQLLNYLANGSSEASTVGVFNMKKHSAA